MKNFRIRFQALAIVSVYLNLGLTLILDYFLADPNKPHSFGIFDAIMWGGFLVFAVIVLIDSLMANRYLNTIFKLHKNLDDRTFWALQDASVLRLRKIAKDADQKMSVQLVKVDETLKKAVEFPELLKNKAFQKAVYGFNLAKAENMIVIAGRAAKYIAEEAKRREGRQESRLTALQIEARNLGIDENHIGKDVNTLRDLVEQTREANALLVRARLAGCAMVVEGLLKESAASANAYLARAEQLNKMAAFYGIEDMVREYGFIAYGNLESAERVINQKKDEAELKRLKEAFIAQIEKLEIPHRPSAQKLLDVVLAQRYPSREFHKAVHELNACLARLKA